MPAHDSVTVVPQGAYGRHQGGFIFIGDYIGTACSSDNTAWTVWPDTRKNTADAMVAHWT